MFHFEKASVSRHQARARVALSGPSGSGKTYTALQIARGLGQKVAVIDTERSSAAKYAELFDFAVLELDSFSPAQYIKALQAAEAQDFEVVIIDSLSHAWNGKGGALEMVDVVQRRYRGNTFAAWREVTPVHNAMIDAILLSRCHVIATLRTKTEYVLQENHRGRMVPVKVGLAPVQREGIEYEFDIVANLDQEHTMRVTKTRCPMLDQVALTQADERVGQVIKAWLQGEPPPALPNTAVEEPEGPRRTQRSQKARRAS